MTATAREFDRGQIYKAADGYRWRIRSAKNNKILADGGQGYADKRDTLAALKRVVGRKLVEDLPTSARQFLVQYEKEKK